MSVNPYAAWSINPLTNFSTLSSREQLSHLIGWGILACNAHNAQPWKFIVDEATLCIRAKIDHEALLPKSDKYGRQAIISLGCAVELIRQAAENYGLNPRVKLYNPDIQNPNESFADIYLSPGPEDYRPSPQALELFKAIKNRRMNRSKYNATPPPQEFIQEISNTPKPDTLSVDLITDTPTRLVLSELQYMADRAVIALDGYRHELAEHFLSNDDQTSTTGMPGFTFGLSDKVTCKVREDLQKDGLFNPDWAAGFAAADRDGIRSSQMVVVISVTNDVPEQWLAVGQCFQHYAVLAEKYGLSIAYNAAAVESNGINTMLKLRLKKIGRPTAVFRVGYANEKREHSPRRTAEDVIE